MAEKQQGTIQIWGVAASAGVITWSGKSVTGLVQSVRLTHNFEKREIKNSAGQKVGMIYPDDESLEVVFEFIPSGNSGANALTSAFMPTPGTKCTTSGFPVITIGSFNDAVNGALNASDLWLYEGNGSINLTNDGAATATITLTRYDNITPS